MAQSVSLNGTTYSVPDDGETDWSSLTTYLVALKSAAASVLQFGNSATPSSAGTTYMVPGYNNATTGGTEVFMRIPASGKLSKLYVRATGGPSGGAAAFTVRVGGVDTSLTASLAISGTTAQDTSNTATVTAGDSISIKVVAAGGTSGGAANVFVTVLFTPG